MVHCKDSNEAGIFVDITTSELAIENLLSLKKERFRNKQITHSYRFNVKFQESIEKITNTILKPKEKDLFF